MGRAKIANEQSLREEKLRGMFHRLHQAWGPQHWWPAKTAFEMIVGAYLTQNTAWSNVELALERLRAANLLSIDGIRRTPISELEELVRPAGYFRQKAARLKQFVAHLDARYSCLESETVEVTQSEDDRQPGLTHPDRVVRDGVGNRQSERDDRALAEMLSRPTEELRAELLSLNGVGPETADSILLYAGLHPVFVVDAYTKRILSRHGIVSEDAKYEDVRTLVERALRDVAPPLSPDLGDRVGDPCDDAQQVARKIFRPSVHQPSALSTAPRSERAQVFGEFHGLIVQVGKHFCLKQHPRCEECPLCDLLPGRAKCAPQT